MFGFLEDIAKAALGVVTLPVTWLLMLLHLVAPLQIKINPTQGLL